MLANVIKLYKPSHHMFFGVFVCLELSVHALNERRAKEQMEVMEKREKRPKVKLKRSEERELRDAIGLLRALNRKDKNERQREKYKFEYETMKIMEQDNQNQHNVVVQIKRFWPEKASVNGGVPIFLETSPNLDGPVFCRFGGVDVLLGNLLDNNTVMCVTPAFPRGSVSLDISPDQSVWIGPVFIQFVRDRNWDFSVLIVFVCVGLIGGPMFLVISVVRAYFFRSHKKSDDHKEFLTLSTPQSPDAEIRSCRSRRNVI